MTRPTAVDLFAGAGGMSLGFEQAGFDVLAAVEVDPIPAAVYKHNFPRTEIIVEDVTRISVSTVRNAARRGWLRHGRDGTFSEDIDVVFGGPSCQGFSRIGRRNVEDTRNLLVAEFARLVLELQPKFVCMENVPGLLDSPFRSVLDQSIALLESAGYRFDSDILRLDAYDYGVPQRRSRIFVVGVRDLRSPELLLTPRSRVTVADAFDGLPEPTNYPELASTDCARLGPEDVRSRHATKSPYARALAGLAPDSSDFSEPRTHRRLWITNSLLTSHTRAITRRFARTSPGTVESISRYYRLAWDLPSRTLRAGTGSDRGSYTAPRPIHPVTPRVITVREAARLHSFPDWFRFNATNWHGHRQIGNAVPPLLAREIAAAILRRLGEQPTRETLPAVLPSSQTAKAVLRKSMSRSNVAFDERLTRDSRVPS